MSVISVSPSSGWLFSTLNDKRTRIAHLFAEIAGLGIPGMMKPKIFQKFLALLAQIAIEKEKEGDFLVFIEAIELRHHFHRDHNQLEHANPDFLVPCEMTVEPDGQCKGLWPRLRGFLDPEG